MVREVVKNEALEKAKKELLEELQRENIKLFKKKLKSLADAKAIVKNIEREISALEKEIDAGL